MKTITKLLACTMIGLLSGLSSTVYAAHGDDVHFDNCKLDLPNPVLEFTATEDYEANGKLWTRYWLSVKNRDSYPQELFRSAPDLPPCGLNKSSARTWVNILDSGNRIYGFCALSSPDNLDKIWFAKERGSAPPKLIHVELVDRSCNKTYTSNRIKIDNSLVSVDCDADQSLNDAIEKVDPNGTVRVTGTCTDPEPLVIDESKNDITLVGLADGSTVIDAGGKDSPAVTIDGATNVTIKKLTFVNSNTAGVLFTGKAGGRLLEVTAKNNMDGILVTDSSHVKFDKVTASHNLANGIKISDKARARFMNLEKPETPCPDPGMQLPVIKPIPQKILPLKTVSINPINTTPLKLTSQKTLFFSSQGVTETESDTDTTDPAVEADETSGIHNCSVVANNNGNGELGTAEGEDIGHGIIVDGGLIITDPSEEDDPLLSSTYSRLDIINCLVEITNTPDPDDLSESDEILEPGEEAIGNQSTGLEIIRSGRVIATGSTVIIEDQIIDGMYISGASTLELFSYPSAEGMNQDIKSRIESMSNEFGMKLIGSSVILNDGSTMLFDNNSSFGTRVTFLQSFQCNDPDASIEFTNNIAGEVEYDPDIPVFPGFPEITPHISDTCIKSNAVIPDSP